MLLDPLVAFATQRGGNAAQQVAAAHVTFNALGASALVLLLAPVGQLLQRLVPARQRDGVPEVSQLDPATPLA